MRQFESTVNTPSEMLSRMAFVSVPRLRLMLFFTAIQFLTRRFSPLKIY